MFSPVMNWMDRVTMTVAVVLGGLVPLMWSEGPGIDVMRPVAVPIIGGMLTAPLFSLLVVPAIYLLVFAAPPQRERSWALVA